MNSIIPLFIFYSAKQLSLNDNINALKQHMTGVGIPNCKSSLKCFTADEAVTTLQYFHSSLFQHYRLFQYLFSETQEQEVIQDKVKETVHDGSSNTRVLILCAL